MSTVSASLSPSKHVYNSLMDYSTAEFNNNNNYQSLMGSPPRTDMLDMGHKSSEVRYRSIVQ